MDKKKHFRLRIYAFYIWIALDQRSTSSWVLLLLFFSSSFPVRFVLVLNVIVLAYCFLISSEKFSRFQGLKISIDHSTLTLNRPNRFCFFFFSFYLFKLLRRLTVEMMLWHWSNIKIFFFHSNPLLTIWIFRLNSRIIVTTQIIPTKFQSSFRFEISASMFEFWTMKGEKILNSLIQTFEI